MAVVPGELATDIQATDTVQVLDPNGDPSALIITRSDAFKVGMEFEILSKTVKALLGKLSYEVKYFAESIGKGPEYDLGVAGPKQTVAGQAKYNATTPVGYETALDVPANTLDAGVYRLAAMVSFKLACPNTAPTPFPLTAFAEGPAIEVYE